MNSTMRLVASSRTPIGFEQRDDAVVVGGEGLVLAGVEALVAAVGVDQPRLVEAVAAHHAADGVGEQPLDVFFTVGAVEGDLVVGDFGGKFVLQAVGFDKEAVVLLFQFLHVDRSAMLRSQRQRILRCLQRVELAFWTEWQRLKVP